MYMRKELEGARYSNSALLDNNSNLQVEIDSLNNHIRVITHQNEELTKELDQFVSLCCFLNRHCDSPTSSRFHLPAQISGKNQ